MEWERGHHDRARRQIQEMLAETEAPTELAGLYYELWRMDGEEKNAQAAYKLYQQVNEKCPTITINAVLPS